MPFGLGPVGKQMGKRNLLKRMFRKWKGLTQSGEKNTRRIQRILRGTEIKQVFINQATMATADNSIQAIHLSAVAEGQDYNQRIGRTIVPVGLKLKMFLQGSSNNVGPQPFRVMLIQVMNNDGSAPTGTQLLETYSTTLNNYSNFNSDFNSDYVRRKRFNNKEVGIKILWEKTYRQLLARNAVSAGVDGGAVPNCALIQKYIPGSRFSKIAYAGVNAGDSRAGAVYLVFFAGVDTTAANNNNFTYQTELLYTD